MNSLGWSRRDPDFPANTSQQSGLLSSIQSLNPFGNRSYVQLPVTEGAGAPLPASNRRDEEEGWLACMLRPAPNFCLYPYPYSHLSSPVSTPTLGLVSPAVCLPCACFVRHVALLHMNQHYVKYVPKLT